MRPMHRTRTTVGEILLEEFLQPRGIPPKGWLHELICGKPLTPETAQRLATLLDTTPEFWMNLR